MYDGLLRVLGIAGRGAGRTAKGRRRGAVVARAVEALEGRTLMSAGGYTAVELTPDAGWGRVYGTLASGDVYGSYSSATTGEYKSFVYRVAEGRSVPLTFDPVDGTAAGDVYGNGPSADGTQWHALLYRDGADQEIDLGTLGGSTSYAGGATPAGDIYGTSTLAGDVEAHAFLYKVGSGEMVDLGGFGGMSGYVYGSSGRGDVYGWMDTPDGTSRGFVYLAGEGRFVDVGTLGGAGSMVMGVTPAGDFFGSADTSDGGRHAFLYHPSTGAMTDLGALGGGQSSAQRALPSGDLWGSATTADGTSHAVLFRVASGRVVDLGTLGGSTSWVDGSLPSGDLYGVSYVAGDAGQHAFIYDVSRETMIDLGTLGGSYSSIAGVLPSGDVYGRSGTATGSEHGFLYNVATGQMTDVTLGGGYSLIDTVTHSGDLYGTSDTAGGARHAFIYHRATGVTEDLGTLGGQDSFSYFLSASRSGALAGTSYLADDMTVHGFVVRQGVMTDVNDLVQPGVDPITWLAATYQGTLWGSVDVPGVGPRMIMLRPNDPVSTVTVSAGTVGGSPGAAVDGVVGSFTDDRADAAAGEFTVVIDWGDGATTYGTAVRRADGGWDVAGSHAYAAAGEYRTTVTVADEVAGGYQSSAGSAKVVPPVVAGGTQWSAQGRSVGTLTTFTRAGSSVGEFTALIHWGDGTTSAGVLVEDPNAAGQYVVLGYHTYAGGRVKDFLVTVEILGTDGASATSSVGVSLK